MKKVLQEAYTYAKQWMGQGKVADYIPELAKADPNHLSICITDLGGYTHCIGDSKIHFTIQSIAKIIILATALKSVGFEEVFSRVGMEPTGDSFNSIVRLETMHSYKPFNPMINAGAISVTSCIPGKSPGERFEKILYNARLLLGNQELTYDEHVFYSESKTGGRNRALAYMMNDGKVLLGNVEEHLEVYFKACSLRVTCEEISYFGAILANNGISPRTGKMIIEPFQVKVIRSLMTTCGMYDASGEFAICVGIPSKSGVGGGIMGAVPNRMGIGVYSPALDAKGNSYCGIKAMEFLSHALELSIF
ncbi:glutaminase A [Clostridium pascui]|uniref:glutaminase A n=1 Tax=Clostridium pascui TaxID=46609 RepID=UPI001959872D|nr:glutaminase A [Clostridium pascui]